MARASCPAGCDPKGGSLKKGYFITKWNAQPVPRYQCKACGKKFSSHTAKPFYRQKKPYLNQEVFSLYASTLTQRRMARHLKVTRTTIVRKFLYLARLSRKQHESELLRWGAAPRVQFDEMESFEHTRLKPLTIAVAVDERSGKILATSVAPIPAKGHLSSISRAKYGYRPNRATKARARVLRVINQVSPFATVVTDAHPQYPALIESIVPGATHKVAHRAKRAFQADSSRRNVDDELFRLNHMASTFRHDLSRLLRRVWVTTKKASRLEAHLGLYIAYHNNYRLAC
jgi:transposase-like protein